MPEKLDEGEVQDILDAYDRTGTYGGEGLVCPDGR